MGAAGAAGFVVKEEAPETIVAGEEQLWTAEQLARTRRWREAVQEPWESLTEREREVLALVAQGKSNREIAAGICVTEKTVEKHVTNVLGKLALSSRTEAALWVVRNGLVES